jgi:hypothetical protein
MHYYTVFSDTTASIGSIIPLTIMNTLRDIELYLKKNQNIMSDDIV